MIIKTPLKKKTTQPLLLDPNTLLQLNKSPTDPTYALGDILHKYQLESRS